MGQFLRVVLMPGGSFVFVMMVGMAISVFILMARAVYPRLKVAHMLDVCWLTAVPVSLVLLLYALIVSS